MAITEIPTVATFGGPKESLRALAESAKRQSSANQNAVNEWLVKLATAVGKDDGSTVGSLRAAVQALERPYSDTRTHTETTAAYTWSSGLAVKRLVINRTGSQCAVTLDESDWEDGTTGRLDVLDSGGFGVQIIVGGGNILNGQTAGVGYATLPGSTNGFDGMPPSYEVTRIDGGWTIRSMVDVADGVVDAFIDMSGRVDALEVTGRQVITTSTATILPGTRVVYIDHAAARTDLTLPATPFEPFTIKKRATSGGFGVRLIPASGSDAIQGLAAGTNFDIGWMTTNASTTTARPAAFVSSSAVNVVDVA